MAKTVRFNVTLPHALRARVEEGRLPGESTVQAIRRILHDATQSDTDCPPAIALDSDAPGASGFIRLESGAVADLATMTVSPSVTDGPDVTVRVDRATSRRLSRWFAQHAGHTGPSGFANV